MNSWSSASHSTRSEPIAWKRARSPLTFTGRCRSAIAVPCPMTPLGFCGFLNLTSPASRSGLIEMIFAPFCLAISRAESMRGWLVPGFWPAMTMTDAVWTSSSVTLPLPIPIVSVSAEPEDSWHMFEQSGRLLVPNARTSNWYRNAASLLVRPEV